MNVLKFGGTSVGSAQRIQAVAQLISDDQPKIVVLSAMSGTTNQLIEITKALYQDKQADATNIIQNMELNYLMVCNELYSTNVWKQTAGQFVRDIFTYLRSFSTLDFHPLQEKIIVAQGEILSTTLMYYYLQEQNITSTLLPALDFMRVDKDREPDYFYIEQNLNRLLAAPTTQGIIITQGFICRNVHGQIDNLLRGGSDYSAALIGAAIHADEIQIWTDIDGVHNNDPRYVTGTHAIRQLSFDEAAELAYFGAKILHPSSIAPAKKTDIPVRLKNTLNPTDEGTLIIRDSTTTGIRAIAAKDDITAIKIQSSHMLLAYGFVKKVFEVFENWKTPIDMIATSEVAISLTIDDTRHLAEIKKELARYGTIEIEEKLSIICVTGNFKHDTAGVVAQVVNALTDIPLHMISYGASDHSVSLLVAGENKQRALVALHNHLFNTPNN